MRKFTIIVSLVFAQLTFILGQVRPDTSFKNFFFDCRGDSVKIKLPSDFIGPKYESGEEGPIVYFVAPDLSIVSVLCAENTILQLDRDYIEIDSTKINRKIYNVSYFNRKKNLYARELQTKKRFYMYSDALLKRKRELDKAFEILEKEENK
jgi:hypothetical protein